MDSDIDTGMLSISGFRAMFQADSGIRFADHARRDAAVLQLPTKLPGQAERYIFFLELAAENRAAILATVAGVNQDKKFRRGWLGDFSILCRGFLRGRSLWWRAGRLLLDRRREHCEPRTAEQQQ